MPPFNLQGFALSVALTRDMRDRERAMQLAFVGGMIGGANPAGVLLVSALARAEDGDTVPGRPPAGGGPVAQLPDVSRVQVPDLPRDPDEAAELLTQRGLKAAIVRVESDDPMELVIGSDPPSETVVRRGSTVDVLVSAGIPVPGVVGEPAQAAEEEVSRAGFSVDLTESKKAGRPDHVAEQDPAAGTFAEAGTTVTLTVFRSRSTLQEVPE
jgi:serine/threonine-protein kinase